MLNYKNSDLRTLGDATHASFSASRFEKTLVWDSTIDKSEQ